MMKQYGLDVSQRETAVCVVGDDGTSNLRGKGEI
jgi:hypothetical protein